MEQESDAGLLVYRIRNDPEILLIQPGGPFWSNKDGRTWCLPKSIAESSDLLGGARRQFTKDTGLVIEGQFVSLDPLQQKGGKVLQGFAVECDLDLEKFHSNEFSLEWPPGSGRLERFPEIDRIEYFDLRTAVRKILPAQWPLLLDASEKLAWRLPRKEHREA